MMMTPLTDIGGFIWSDHALIYLEFRTIEHERSRGTWRLNDNLIRDKECKEDIVKTIKEFLTIHENDETAIPIQWEALKCVVRGVFIKHGSRLKKNKGTKKTPAAVRN